MNSEWGEPGCLAQLDWRDTIDQQVPDIVQFVVHHQGAVADDVWAYVKHVAEQSQVTLR
jgi:hypothetical protein